MKRILLLLISILLLISLVGCERQSAETEPTKPIASPETTEPATTAPETTEPETTEPETTEPEATEAETTEPETTAPETTEPETTVPEHSELYLTDVPVEDVITWFNEVCLDSEFVNGGDPTRIQKWAVPIRYMLHGDATPEDIATMESFVQWLNTVEGFPGISETQSPEEANLHIHFTDEQGLTDIMGPDYYGLDGAVTFWYMDDMIYDEVICIRTDIDQQVRNSVILEELYNGLGPIQDTMLRPDSLIWQEFSAPQELTAVDQLILKLLYHPQILCGMNAPQCEDVIRTLYY